MTGDSGEIVTNFGKMSSSDACIRTAVPSVHCDILEGRVAPRLVKFPHILMIIAKNNGFVGGFDDRD